MYILTVGVAALLVKGNNWVLTPPPNMNVATFFGSVFLLSNCGGCKVYHKVEIIQG